MVRSYRHLRWAAPSGVVAVAAAVAVGSAVGVAQAAPVLPSRTPAQLLAAAAASTSPPPPLMGTVVETASMGIPQLPGSGNPASITSLLAGSHTIKVWYENPRHVRLALPVSLGETDVIRNGDTAWLWQSRLNSVTRYRLPSGPAARQQVPAPQATPLTPQQAVREALALAGKTTRITLDANVRVAGQPAYQLVLTPTSHGSQIGKIRIALDGKHPQVPLRVQVFARGAAHPAFQTGYTSVSFVTPAPANFSFSPPHGASMHTVTPGSQAGGSSPSPAGHASGQPPTQPGAPVTAPGTGVIGTGWLSVAVLPSSALTGLAGSGNAASAFGQAARSASGAGGSVSGAAVLGALLKSATPVKGSWGRGRLLHTSLVSVLITSNGKVLAGAVTPRVLYAAAAKIP